MPRMHAHVFMHVRESPEPFSGFGSKKWSPEGQILTFRRVIFSTPSEHSKKCFRKGQNLTIRRVVFRPSRKGLFGPSGIPQKSGPGGGPKTPTPETMVLTPKTMVLSPKPWFWAVLGVSRKSPVRLEPSARQFGQNMGFYPCFEGFDYTFPAVLTQNRGFGAQNHGFGLENHGFGACFRSQNRGPKQGFRDHVLGGSGTTFLGFPEGPQNRVQKTTFRRVVFGSKKHGFRAPFWHPKTCVEKPWFG